MTRRFAPGPLGPQEHDELVAMLDLARRAPSAGYSQGVHFLLLTGPDLVAFWQGSGAGDWFARTQPGVLGAQALVIPLADEQAYTSRYAESDKAGHGLEDPANWPVPFWLTDAAMATQNLLLLAEESGWGALYFGLFAGSATAVRSLGVPARVVPLGAVALGRRAADDRPSGSAVTRPRRGVDEVVHLQRW